MKRWQLPESNRGLSNFSMFGGWQRPPGRVYDMRVGMAFEMRGRRLVCFVRCNGYSWSLDARWKPQHHEIPDLPNWPRGVWS